MTITVCDRCGAEIVLLSTKWGVMVEFENPQGHKISTLGRDYCIQCMADVQNKIEAVLKEDIRCLPNPTT